jgi:hypothetical protein
VHHREHRVAIVGAILFDWINHVDHPDPTTGSVASVHSRNERIDVLIVESVPDDQKSIAANDLVPEFLMVGGQRLHEKFVGLVKSGDYSTDTQGAPRLAAGGRMAPSSR